MGLIVALDDEDEATGSLFWDDGESIGKHHFCHYTCGFEIVYTYLNTHLKSK